MLPFVLLVCRFTATPADAPGFLARARRVLELLTAAAGCQGGELGRSVDEPDRWVLAVRFVSVDAYRRALAPFPVREHVVPLLSEALADEPATYETLVTATTGTTTEHPTLLADS
ncbi:MAG: antibiotic biosynthesis monooxygenase family protein [Pseudonocardia sp.]